MTAAAPGLVGCAPLDGDPPSDDVGVDDSAVKVDTQSPEARRQFEANVTFALSYRARCPSGPATRPRALVTGFGRFQQISDNASGRIVSALVPEARYPSTRRPSAGEVDPPASQVSVGARAMTLPGVSGPVEVCAVILPVSWDLAASLVAKELEAFQPSFVLMNGVAGPRQKLWLELGATNRAAALDDGSNELRPVAGPGERQAPLVESASPRELAQPNLLAWDAVESAARAALHENASDVASGVRFGDIAPDVARAGFPRPSNTYLCNNLTYTTGYLMTHPNEEIRLLRASTEVPGKPSSVPTRLTRDMRRVPRVFVHWPSDLARGHAEGGAEVVKAILGAQLGALARGERATPGDNATADPTLRHGAVY